ncbi:MAG TPA: SirB2 family protein, partial [Pseudomonadales bacterium]|nr:SirB2 family protein [Pseudomonadales bacterium]
MTYQLLKMIHMVSVALSGSFFLLRGIWMLRDSALLQRKWVKIAPHVIDTVLLVSALAMCVMIGQYPFTVGWLTA